MVFNFTVRHDHANEMTAHWSRKLDPYWSIEDMMKIFQTLADVNNLNTECYVIQSKKCKQK